MRSPERAARLHPGRRHGPPLPTMDRPQAAGSNIPADITLGKGEHGFRRGPGQGYRPRLRPMISFMISVVPAKPCRFLMEPSPFCCGQHALPDGGLMLAGVYG